MNRPESHGITWRTSSYSTNGGNCVEVGWQAPDVLVRDTKDRASGTISLDRAAWSALLDFQREA